MNIDGARGIAHHAVKNRIYTCIDVHDIVSFEDQFAKAEKS